MTEKHCSPEPATTFGDGFAKAFGIQYTDKENKLQYVHQTSWGMTTRLIGAIIMVHGDDSGLVLPPQNCTGTGRWSSRSSRKRQASWRKQQKWKQH